MARASENTIFTALVNGTATDKTFASLSDAERWAYHASIYEQGIHIDIISNGEVVWTFRPDMTLPLGYS